MRTIAKLALVLCSAALCCWSQHTASGPITIRGQNGIVIDNVRITSSTGNCITVSNSTNITIKNSDIGPCGTAGGTITGNGIRLSGNNRVYIYDNYIHTETLSTSCCDNHDGIYGTNGNQNITIQGNVIAYGESNIEFTGKNLSLTVVGNFLLNPRGPYPRGQNFQCYGSDSSNLCSNVTFQNNYTFSTPDTSRYLYPENQEDSINFGRTNEALVQDNYITGGHSLSGCGLIADDAADSVQFKNNKLLNTGQCGIAIADGTKQFVSGNKVYNTNPVPKAGNTAIYAWKQYKSACGPTTVSNNIADEIRSDGSHSGWWDGGGCGVTLSGNIFNAAADSLLTPVSTVFPPPLIPPKPKNCVVTSPYTMNTTFVSGVPLCSGIHRIETTDELRR